MKFGKDGIGLMRGRHSERVGGMSGVHGRRRGSEQGPEWRNRGRSTLEVAAARAPVHGEQERKGRQRKVGKQARRSVSEGREGRKAGRG